MFEFGQLGEKVDYLEAFKWNRKAAEAGSPVAQNDLGGMYENGWGLEPNKAEALKWYRQAALSGCAEAQKNLTRLGD